MLFNAELIIMYLLTWNFRKIIRASSSSSWFYIELCLLCCLFFNMVQQTWTITIRLSVKDRGHVRKLLRGLEAYGEQILGNGLTLATACCVRGGHRSIRSMVVRETSRNRYSRLRAAFQSVVATVERLEMAVIGYKRWTMRLSILCGKSPWTTHYTRRCNQSPT